MSFQLLGTKHVYSFTTPFTKCKKIDFLGSARNMVQNDTSPSFYIIRPYLMASSQVLRFFPM